MSFDLWRGSDGVLVLAVDRPFTVSAVPGDMVRITARSAVRSAATQGTGYGGRGRNVSVL